MSTAPDFAAPELTLVPEPPAPRRLAVVPAESPAAIEVFDAALERARPRLQRYAARRLGDAHEAEEVVQEALLRGYQHRATFATEDDLMAWLTVVTGRLAIDRLRVRGRTIAVGELPPTARTTRDTAEVVVARAEARIALDALEAMPGRQAAVLWAREVDGLSYDEIAGRYGLSEPTVRSLLHRARRTLRREYAARGGSVPVGGLVVLAPWLRGMRLLPRLRDLGRRAGIATATATGLAVAGVLAIGAGQAPTTHAVTPPVGQAQVITVAAPAAVAAHRRVPTVTRPTVRRAATSVSAAPAGEHRTWSVPVATLCGARLQVDCATHKAPAIYLTPALPANPMGWSQIGVSNDAIDCRLMPATPLTQCVPGNDGTSGGRP